VVVVLARRLFPYSLPFLHARLWLGVLRQILAEVVPMQHSQALRNRLAQGEATWRKHLTH